MLSLLQAFDEGTVLISDRLLLRKMTRHDVDDMYEYASDPAVSRYLLWSPHSSRAYTKQYLETVLRGYRRGGTYDFAVVLKESGKMIGTCGFTSVHESSSAGEAGYVISPAYHGMGLATEALMLLLRWGFCDLFMNRIEARYMVENEASRAVMERCGMRSEGVMRELLYVKGAYRDIGICAMLRREFIERFGSSSALDSSALHREGEGEKKRLFFS